MVTDMAGSTWRTGSRLMALVTAGLLGVGLAVTPGMAAFASETETETDGTIMVQTRHPNVLCVLFPDLVICKNKN